MPSQAPNFVDSQTNNSDGAKITRNSGAAGGWHGLTLGVTLPDPRRPSGWAAFDAAEGRAFDLHVILA